MVFLVKNLINYYLSYSAVGISAAFFHFGFVFICHDFFAMSPLLVNPFGFAIGFLISYFGQHFFTFSGHNSKHVFAMPSYLLMQLIAMFFHQLLLWFFYDFIGLNLVVSLSLSSILIAPITFVISSRYIFRNFRS